MQFFKAVGIVPLGIGLIFLFGIWSSDSPFAFTPAFFKLLMSFVAVMFVLTGGGILFAGLNPENRLKSMVSSLKEIERELGQGRTDRGTIDRDDSREQMGGYQCSNCGATLSDSADVSPHGDVKCEHCGRWFNIHRA